ncbi:MAG: hypothetical protein IPM47_10265 [Sphingobacteriales bacterium]|nr:MAG: hypothetical protein IPM47_10265 [Sphingobacteriales bacterium]
MTLLDLKQQFCFERFQTILFDRNGQLIESCNTLFDLATFETQNIFDLFPVLDGVKDALFTFSPNSSQNINIPRVEFSFGNHSFLSDFTVSSVLFNNTPVFVCHIQNLTEQYQHLIVIQQERNESIIEGQQLRIENEILSLHKDIDLLNKLRQARKELNINVASELEAPLNKIMALAAKLKDTAMTENEANYLSAIEASVAVLDDQLTLNRPAQLDLFLIPPERTLLDLPALIWNVLKIFEYNQQIKESPFYLRVNPGFPTLVIGNKPRIAQLLHNFLYHGIFGWKSLSTTLTASVIEIKPTHCNVEFFMSCAVNKSQIEETQHLSKQINEDLTALTSNLKGKFSMYFLPEDQNLLMKLSLPFRLPNNQETST